MTHDNTFSWNDLTLDIGFFWKYIHNVYLEVLGGYDGTSSIDKKKGSMAGPWVMFQEENSLVRF